MTINHDRRSKMVGFVLRQHTWELETFRARNRKMSEALSKADEELQQIDEVIEQAESTIRRALEGKTNMDLAAIQAARHFVADQQEVRQERAKEQRRAAQRARQAESQLKEATLYVKALKKVKETSDGEVRSAEEKKLADQNADLWLQRFGQGKWQTS